MYHRGTCLCLVCVSKANLRAFCLSFSQFIRQIPLLFVTANIVLVKDGSGSAQLSLQQLGWESAAVRDHTGLHLAFLLPHFSRAGTAQLVCTPVVLVGDQMVTQRGFCPHQDFEDMRNIFFFNHKVKFCLSVTIFFVQSLCSG